MKPGPLRPLPAAPPEARSGDDWRTSGSWPNDKCKRLPGLFSRGSKKVECESSLIASILTVAIPIHISTLSHHLAGHVRPAPPH